MKASELMLGDFVRFKCTHPQLTPNIVAIFGIVFDSKVSKKHLVHIVFKETGLVQYNYDPDVFEGVPLTPEILEKNGFGRCASSIQRTDTMALPVCDSKQFYHEELGNLRIEDKRPCHGWSITAAVFGDVTRFAIHHIEYVHELQHALRLCGIEKEIEL